MAHDAHGHPQAAPDHEPALPKVLVVASVTGSELDEWRAAGCDVIPNPHLDKDTLESAVRDLDPIAIVTAGVAVCDRVMAAGKSLSLVIHRGSGAGAIDVKAATERGIQIAHCPGIDAASMAEHVIALLLACDRSIGVHESTRPCASGLKGRSIGIVGFGAVGREVARRALAFGMRVLAWNDPPIDEAFSEMGIHPCEAMINVARLCDMVAICVPDADSKPGLVSAKFLSALHPGAIVVDTSKSGTVDANALAERLRTRSIVVGRDRFDGDAERTAFASLPGTVCTRNSAGDSAESHESYRTNALRVLASFLRTGRAPNLLNAAGGSDARYVLLVRHRNEPGVLSHTLGVLGRAGLNVEDLDNHGLARSQTGVATMHLQRSVPEPVLSEILADSRVLGALCLAPSARRMPTGKSHAHA
ncbi:MAG: NAD(P)-dependent oxidoreductase [Planctomycetota bacterium]|nr:NAD(P)-dependent oxidoreductase [Planctomycetota bacterium]MDA1105631.1 NAD(P)-dependent oxidoreductase [Planctomycetota bacterium]